MFTGLLIYYILPLGVTVCFFYSANRAVKMGAYMCLCAICHTVFFNLTAIPIPIRRGMMAETESVFTVSVMLFVIGVLLIVAGKLFLKK